VCPCVDQLALIRINSELKFGEIEPCRVATEYSNRMKSSHVAREVSYKSNGILRRLKTSLQEQKSNVLKEYTERNAASTSEKIIIFVERR
jgi:hypothetical protein